MAGNRKTSTRLYGDDLVLFKEDINLAANYCQEEQFKHNCAKTKFVSFGRFFGGDLNGYYFEHIQNANFSLFAGECFNSYITWKAPSGPVLLYQILYTSLVIWIRWVTDNSGWQKSC